MTLIDKTAYFEILVKKNFKKDAELVKKVKEDGFPSAVVDFYALFNGFRLKWRFQGDLVGGVNFLPAEHLYDATGQNLSSGETDWFIDDQPVKLKGIYHPLEFFTDEASVGFMSTTKSGELYYYDSGAVFYSLNIDLTGYCRMLDHTYGLLRWPRLLLGLRDIAFQDTVDSFVKDIQTVNPHFNLANFKELYAECQANLLSGQ